MLFETFPKLKLLLHFGQKTSTLNELIGYIDLTDCRKIWQKHSEDNDEQNGVFFPKRPFTQHVSNVFTYSSFERGHLDTGNQSEY